MGDRLEARNLIFGAQWQTLHPFAEMEFKMPISTLVPPASALLRASTCIFCTAVCSDAYPLSPVPAKPGLPGEEASHVCIDKWSRRCQFRLFPSHRSITTSSRGSSSFPRLGWRGGPRRNNAAPLTERELGQPGLSCCLCGHGGHGIEHLVEKYESTERTVWLNERVPPDVMPDMHGSSEAAAVLEKRLALPQ